MQGFLDELEQAFLTAVVGGTSLDFVIDTGFSGSLIIGVELFDPAGSTFVGTMSAALADEHIANYDTFKVSMRWFDRPVSVLVLVLVGPGKTCLIGTDLLKPHRLEVDYGDRTVALKQNPAW